jgi:hypothetical protein
MTPRLAAVVKRVVELHDVSVRACHCAKEFTLWWIHPLGCHERLAYECRRLANPSRDLGDSTILISVIADVDLLF